ncbi:peptidoglycan DD-metalloendopeptidase family protein [Sorangium sp. So ce590]|uniref:peptidoglycan DD-metalloendopeptidase family protein n=1 Tax=Sorangium sp. So ce590 TaxID=3133317 RepID=UPI003F5F4186
MRNDSRSAWRYRGLGLLGLMLASACGSAAEEGDAPNEGSDEEPGSLGGAGLPLTSASFLFAHPLQGSSYRRECNFNTTRCFVTGKYHSGIDESAAAGLAIRAANFGERTLVVNNGSSDHGLGNVVTIRHLLQDGTYLWWLNAHMSSHHPLNARPDGSVAVTTGTKLGEVGGTGGGEAHHWGNHLHAEAKLGNVLRNPCGSRTYYGYLPSNAENFCYRNPDSYIGSRGVMIPEFNLSERDAWGDYDVLYGVASAPIYTRLRLVAATESFSKLLVGGRAGFSDEIVDFPAGRDATGTVTYTAMRTFSAGDYTFFAAVQAPDASWRAGYRVIFSVLPSANDFIRDNDMAATYFERGGLGLARGDGYGYGAYMAVGGSGAWGRWYTRKAGSYGVYVYVGGAGNGSVRYKIFPTGAGTEPLFSDPIDLTRNRYSWVPLRVRGATSWSFATNGYVGLSTEEGSAATIYTFDAVKFIRR